MTDGRFILFGGVIIRQDAISCVRVNSEKKHILEVHFSTEIQKWDCGTPEHALEGLEQLKKILC